MTLYLVIKKGGIVPGMAELEGYCGQARWIFADAGDEPKNFDDGYYPKVFKVIGPVAEPQNPSSFISALIEWTVYSYNKGWISSYDVYQGLMDKLSAVMGQILQGKEKYHTAVNILGAFQNLLDAQRGKAITEQCYQMLYVDAEILIKRLKS
ncbi:MAG: hypothetical protein HPY53_06875 [Brevinematales bacterium]|nr:hypothetical protein [Brevinematales bacterium]